MLGAIASNRTRHQILITEREQYLMTRSKQVQPTTVSTHPGLLGASAHPWCARERSHCPQTPPLIERGQLLCGDASGRSTDLVAQIGLLLARAFLMICPWTPFTKPSARCLTLDIRGWNALNHACAFAWRIGGRWIFHTQNASALAGNGTVTWLARTGFRAAT